MQYYNLTSIILKREDHKENDVLITAYSKEKGKLSLFLKGGKNIISKLAGHVEPVSLTELNVIGRRASNDQIIGAQMIKAYGPIKDNTLKLGYASYFLEMIDGLIKEEQEDENIFELLQRALDRLAGVEEIKNLPIVRLMFVYKLLNLLGYRPRVKDLKLTESIEFILGHGTDEVLKNELVLSNQQKLFEVAQENLKQHLEKPLKSEEFIKIINNQTPIIKIFNNQ